MENANCTQVLRTDVNASRAVQDENSLVLSVQRVLNLWVVKVFIFPPENTPHLLFFIQARNGFLFELPFIYSLNYIDHEEIMGGVLDPCCSIQPLSDWSEVTYQQLSMPESSCGITAHNEETLIVRVMHSGCE